MDCIYWIAIFAVGLQGYFVDAISENSSTIRTTSNSIRIVVDPESQTVLLNYPATLNCVYERSVSCSWTRNGSAISNQFGYVYNHLSTNCSLWIRAVGDIDLVKWRCSSLVSDHYYTEASKEALLSSKHGEVNATERHLSAAIISHPESLVSNLGPALGLTCKFNQSVRCRWKRNGRPVRMNGRYRFVSSGDVDDYTFLRRDCSFHINSLKAIDVGKWSCYRSADDQSSAVASNDAIVESTHNYMIAGVISAVLVAALLTTALCKLVQWLKYKPEFQNITCLRNAL